jgi:integrase
VLRVTPTGSKTWALVYRRKSDGKKGRVTIGSFGDKSDQIGLSAARERAAILRGEVSAGRDPGLEAAAIRKAETVSELLDAYLKNHPKPKARWTLICAGMFAKDVRPLIGHVRLPELERHHIKAVLQQVKDRKAMVTVNRTLAALRRALAWGVQEDLLKVNPASGIVTAVHETPKDRALDSDEIFAFWHGLDKSPMGMRTKLALRLTLLTGQRPGEVCGMLKSELSLECKTWTLPKGRTKNSQTHVVPLHPMAIDIIQQAMKLDPEQPFLFCTKGRAKGGVARVKPMDSHALSHAMRDSLEALGLADTPATPHDLRRTAATHMARLGFTDHVVGKVLNHGTELRRTITARVYITHDFLSEKQSALASWGNELEHIIDAKTPATNIISLRSA